MKVIPFNNQQEVANWTAQHIVNTINAFNPTAQRPFVLGLPTGDTPINTYRELIRLNQTNEVSFEHVVTFNMDEYVGLDAQHPQSYHYFMYKNLFDHIDINPTNINLLNGMAKNIELECQRYEDKIKSLGQINLMLGGVGRDGHIAFNEPLSNFNSRTRLTSLAQETRQANSRFFNDFNEVPTHALTMCVGTLLDSDEIIILITGDKKAKALQAAIEQPVSPEWVVTALRTHNNSMIVCDDEATVDLAPSTLAKLQLSEIDI